jgi:hypothetical protein
MAKLLDEIRKAVKQKAKLQEAEFHGDDGYSEVPDVVFDKDLKKSNDLESQAKAAVKEDADDDEDKDDKVDVKEAKKGKIPPQFLKKKKAVKEDDDDKDDDKDDMVSEDQENRDEDNVGTLNSKMKAGVDKYSDDEDHVDDLAKKDITDVIGEAADDDEDDDADDKKVNEDDDYSDDDDDDKKVNEDADDDDDDDKDKDQVDEDADADDPDDDDVKDKMQKEARVRKGDINVSEDLKAIFGGTKLTAEFKKRVAGIYEAAVVAKVNEVLGGIVEGLAKDYRKTKKRMAESMVDKIDAYLDKVVSEWVEANKPAVESKLRVEASESFMEGLKSLFEAHYIEVPAGKEDVLESVVKENAALTAKLDKELNESVKLRKKIEEMKKESLLKEAAEGLSANQIQKLKNLSEAVDYENDKQYTEKLVELKEAYFAKKRTVRTVEDDDPIELREEKIDRRSDEVKAVSEVMGRFLRK